jgi:hypothetical protein
LFFCVDCLQLSSDGKRGRHCFHEFCSNTKFAFSRMAVCAVAANSAKKNISEMAREKRFESGIVGIKGLVVFFCVFGLNFQTKRDGCEEGMF